MVSHHFTMFGGYWSSAKVFNISRDLTQTRD